MKIITRSSCALLTCAMTSLAFAEPQIIPLWERGAPGFENRRTEPEEARDYWVRNIHNPSITVFPAPKDKANGAAVLIIPGGGHRELVFKAEGVGRWIGLRVRLVLRGGVQEIKAQTGGET